MDLWVPWKTVSNTESGCTFMAKEQVSYSRGGKGCGGCVSYRDMGQHCEKIVTWL